MLQYRQLWMGAIGFSLLGVSAAAAAAFSKPADSRVTFHAVGPAGLKIEGTTTELNVAEDADMVIVTVPLANLKTGIDIRDRHMKEKYLEVDKYPQAKLAIPRAGLKLPAAGEKVVSEAAGTLTLHGQTKPTRAHYEVKSEGSGFAVDGVLRVNMNDVGITVPVYLGVTVKPDVDVDVHFRIANN